MRASEGSGEFRHNNSGGRTEFPGLDPPGAYVEPYQWQGPPLDDGLVLTGFATEVHSPPMRSAFKRPRSSSAATPVTFVAGSGRPSKSVKRYVKRCLKKQLEVKHVRSVDAYNPATGWTIGLPLPALAQGTSSTTRVGSHIDLTLIDACCILNLNTAQAGDVVRCVLVVDHQPNGAAPAVADIMEDGVANSLYNRDKVGFRGARFTILHDRMVNLSAPSAVVAAGTGEVWAHMRYRRRVKIPVQYQSNAGTVSDIIKNNIFWMFAALNSSTSSSVSCRTQLCYTDA